ncbi:hypothetical protein [Aeromicrobium sp.]|nr:hypothetical protein [Aeromicrobium sp.]
MEQRLSIVAEVLLELAHVAEIRPGNQNLVEELEKQLGHVWVR